MSSKNGSEWNRWDLHFHTPSSYDYGDKSVDNKRIIEVKAENHVSAFAVTDHHCIDIERYNELKALGREKGITVLPGIEFLSDARGKEPIHFIGIFSEECNLEYVWGQIRHKTAIHKIEREGLKPHEVYCNLSDTIRLIHELNGVVSIHAGSKSGTMEGITNSLPHAAAQKKDIAELVDIYELGKESDQAGYKDIVFPAINKKIPMVICSDNHNINKYHIKQKLWIKGSPNFLGLKYALTEPDERFYIGDEPEVIGRVSRNKTKYIKNIRITRSGGFDLEERWFEDVDIPLNKELITIIGNKGSGKSALVDIVGLCCDAEHSEDYLFLDKAKFKRRGLADRFSAEVVFESGKATQKKTLYDDVDSSAQPLVRYLPQTYFERVCNEIGKIESFRQEIEKVVFQYVPQEKRLQSSSFRDLVRLKRSAIDKEIVSVSEKISVLNSEIIGLEDELDAEYKKKLEKQLQVKNDELKAHLESKPSPVDDPSAKDNDPQHNEQRQALDEWRRRREKVEEELGMLRERISQLSLDIEYLLDAKREVSRSIGEVRKYISENTDKMNEFGVNLKSIITLEFDESVLDRKVSELTGDRTSLEAQLVESELAPIEDYENLCLADKSVRCNQEISKIESVLSDEQKAYQKYLRELADWDAGTKEIRGDATKSGSLHNIQGLLKRINEVVPNELNSKRAARLLLAGQIFDLKLEVKGLYDDIKRQIDQKLSQSSGTGLAIASTFFVSSDIVDRLLGNVLQNRIGTFYGADDGRKYLKEELIGCVRWDDKESLSTFLNSFIDCLEHDRRPASKGERTFIGNTVKNRDELYRYLFTLSYIDPYYDLRQNDKSLERLSPGEKGALLLVFYLVLDKEDIPLLIDQPEDNLDNNSVSQVLVPFIREAKKSRQIIMVTHNPNLAVVADSEQVIRVRIDKEGGNLFSYSSGGIESEATRDDIVDVLEGTMPAFKTRELKYDSQ